MSRDVNQALFIEKNAVLVVLNLIIFVILLIYKGSITNAVRRSQFITSVSFIHGAKAPNTVFTMRTFGAV